MHRLIPLADLHGGRLSGAVDGCRRRAAARAAAPLPVWDSEIPPVLRFVVKYMYVDVCQWLLLQLANSPAASAAPGHSPKLYPCSNTAIGRPITRRKSLRPGGAVYRAWDGIGPESPQYFKRWARDWLQCVISCPGGRWPPIGGPIVAAPLQGASTAGWDWAGLMAGMTADGSRQRFPCEQGTYSAFERVGQRRCFWSLLIFHSLPGRRLAYPLKPNPAASPFLPAISITLLALSYRAIPIDQPNLFRSRLRIRGCSVFPTKAN